MQRSHYLPPDSLLPYISFYGIIEVDEHFKEPYVSPPLGLCGFIIYLEGETNARLNGNLFLKHQYCATGQITTAMTGEVSGPSKQVLVFIQPCGLYQLFGIDMSTLTNTSIPLDEFLGKEETDILIGQLNEAGDNEEKIEVMNSFFMAQQPVFEIAPKVKHALDYIHQYKGNVTIKDIEKNCFITSRSLERHFKIYTGLSPKEYAKIFRFKCLMNYIKENPGLTWSALCEENGYYDQSHITRYFNRYLKIKPNELVNVDMEFINYLLQD